MAKVACHIKEAGMETIDSLFYLYFKKLIHGTHSWKQLWRDYADSMNWQIYKLYIQYLLHIAQLDTNSSHKCQCVCICKLSISITIAHTSVVNLVQIMLKYIVYNISNEIIDNGFKIRITWSMDASWLRMTFKKWRVIYWSSWCQWKISKEGNWGWGT